MGCGNSRITVYSVIKNSNQWRMPIFSSLNNMVHGVCLCQNDARWCLLSNVYTYDIPV